MTAMIALKRGSVVLVPFPFSDLVGVKKRPALVVSTDAYNAAGPDVLIAQITSRVATQPRPGDHRIVQWQEAGLLLPSLLRARITTLEAGLVLRVMGLLAAEDMLAAERGLREALGFLESSARTHSR